MKKILFLHSSADLYGSDNSLYNIINNLDKNEYEIHVILPYEGPLYNKLKLVNNIKLNCYPVAILRRKNLSIKGFIKYFKDLKGSIKYLKRYIKENNIDIVETNTSVVFPGAIAAKKMKVKSLWHIREIISNKFENYIISKLMNRYADIIIANSKSTAESLKVKKSKIRVIYNSINQDIILSKKENKEPIIGMAGRINRWKGQKLFVEAAKIVHNTYPDAIFKIAGDVYPGEEYLKEELCQVIAENKLQKNIKLCGHVDDMDKFYNSIDIFVLPSIKPEPFGLVVIEAMLHKIPVIATNHGGPTEIIENNKTGILVDYNSPNEMAQAIIKLIEDKNLKYEIVDNAYIEAKNKYSIDTMIKEIEKIYKKI